MRLADGDTGSVSQRHMVICAGINIAHVYDEGFRSTDKGGREGLKDRSKFACKAHHFVVVKVKAYLFV